LQPFVLLFGQPVTLSSYLSIFLAEPADFGIQTCINTLIMSYTVLQHPKELEYLKEEWFLTQFLFLDHTQLLEYSAHFFFALKVLLRIAFQLLL
jgi:hypothetical protein